MKKPIVFLLAICVLVALTISGCVAPKAAPESKGWGEMQGVAQKPDGTSYTFGITVHALQDDWMVTLAGVLQTMLNRAGGEAKVYDAQYDVSTQIANLEDFREMKQDAVVVHPVDSAACLPMVDALVEAGVPVFNLDMLVPSQNLSSYVSDSHLEAGRIAGQWFDNYVKDTGTPLTIYELWGSFEMEGSQLRHEGLHEFTDANPLITVIESGDTKWTNENAMNFVIDALPTHPEINAIFTPGAMHMGILEALSTLDRLYPKDDPRHVIWVAGNDNLPAVNAIKEGTADALMSHSPWEIADACSKIILTNICCGLPVEKEYWLSVYIIDEGNIDSPRYAPEGWTRWGSLVGQVPFDEWPELVMPEIIDTPT
jgi:ABC-type sugar transport system substrate-binding protein